MIKFWYQFLVGQFTLYGGGSGGGGPSSSTTQTSNIPEYARPYVETMLGATQQQLFNTKAGPEGTTEITGVKPYTPYSTDPNAYVAGFSPMQQQAQRGVAGMQVPGQYGTASNMTEQSAGLSSLYGNLGAQAGQGYANLSGGAGERGAQIGQSLGQMSTDAAAQQAYMNPYVQNALNPQLAEIQRQYDVTGTQQQGNATKSGAFGGSREALMAAENQRNAGLAKNLAIGQGYEKAFTNAQEQMRAANQAALTGNQQALSGYGQAGSQALQGYGMGLTGAGQAGQMANQLANIGGQQLQAQQGIYGLQNQYGGQQQAQEQQKINQQIQDYATAQQYPQQQLAFMNAMIRGLPLQTSTTQGYQAPPSALSQIGGLGTTALAGYKLANMKKGGPVKMAKGGLVSLGLYNATKGLV